jgi:rare lipoprotein A (peptidoglycan hydrolase)
MLAKLFLQYVLAAAFGIGVDDGYATLYGFPGDELAGTSLACAHRAIPQDEPVCAHRWLPCGTQISVSNLERPGNGVCWVGDRGPYGIDHPTNRWRGILDMTPFAARQVRLDGKDGVLLLYALPPPDSPIYDDRSALDPDNLRAKYGPIM